MSIPKFNSCKKCGTDNPLLQINCRQCSEPLYAPGVTPVLKNCVHCNEAVSVNAETCPHCGYFYQNLRMLGWKGTIAWGVIYGYLGIVIITFIVFVLGNAFLGELLPALFGRR